MLCAVRRSGSMSDAILDFDIRLYGGFELSKHLSKGLLWMRKMLKIEPDPNFFKTDETLEGSV